MYLRRHTIRRDGRPHTYWSLVRSVRRGAKVRQETVTYLGELDGEGRAKASALAEHFLGSRARQRDLFEATEPVEPVSVRLRELRVERSRAFGGVWLGLRLWEALELDAFCRSHLPEGREAVPWPEMAAILVLARLCDPSSELHIAEEWYGTTALEDLLGVSPDLVHHTRLYQGLDQLLPHKEALERHLKDRLGGLFGLDYDLLLYDVTSTYFEGLGTKGGLAARGHSRDGRPDCLQVTIGLVVTREGFPIGYEVFAGNRVDVTTVREIVETMERRFGAARRVWVMDRGMVSEEHLAWLRAGGRKYLVGTPRSEMKKWERALGEKEGWEEVREGLEVKRCLGPGGEETFLLCRSRDRRKKEAAMHDRFARRLGDALERLGRRLAQARRPIEAATVHEQIGRLKERYSRAAGKYRIAVETDPSRPSGLQLSVRTNRDWSEWAALTEGTYILRSNVSDWTGEELWRTYIQLSHAEEAFRIQKSELSIRPIWHQKRERVQAHILVCFLAYALWKTLEGWGKRAGLGSSPRKVLDSLARIPSVDVVLPLADGREMRLRCVVRPEPDQEALLIRLGLTLPKRLRPALPASEM